jgi:UDP-N-acetyl-D-galactosamine dehydrogenase
MNIDTNQVLAAAATKWNFLPFKPGLVGGHCIGVDPYYLAQKAQELGYHPEIILAGRRLNDSMGEYVASQIVKLMIKKGISVNNASLLMLGITFKENCPDVRNTKIVDVVAALTDYGIAVTIYDPLASPAAVFKEYKLTTTDVVPNQKFDALVLGVAHSKFLDLDLTQLQNTSSVIYDVKGVLGDGVDGRL